MGTCVRATWLDTLEAIRSLVSMGLPINIWKCQFLFDRVVVLGYSVEGDKYQLGKNSIARLFAKRLPRSLLEL